MILRLIADRVAVFVEPSERPPPYSAGTVEAAAQAAFDTWRLS
jgi:hypothetical protein